MSQAYTLRIAIDDSKIKEIEKRLMNIVGGGQQQGGGLGNAVTSASSGGNIGKNIAKLGMIAIGVAALVGIVTKIAQMSIQASPMLQQMLKLINFGVLLILRPIGDFFGFFLRPLIIYFLRSIILPWYRLARPIMQKFGTWLGMGAATTAQSNLSGTWALITGDWEAVSRITAESNARIKKFWEDSVTSIGAWITSLNLPSFSDITTGIKIWIFEQVNKLPSFYIWFMVGIRGWIRNQLPQLPSWMAITTGVNTWIEENIGKLPSWDDIITAFGDVKIAILGIAEAITEFFTNLVSDLLERIGITNNNNKNTSGGSNTLMIDINQNGIDDKDDLMNWLSDIFAGKG